MNTRRLAGIAALSVAAASVLVIPGAGAQTVTYEASADGRALALSILGQGITAGESHSDVGSEPSANANGAGIANPLSPVGATSASVDTDGATDGSGTETCETEPLPDIPGLNIDLACSASLASITGGAPASAATGRVGGIDLDPVSGLLIDQAGLGDVVDQVQDGATQVLDGLAPILGPVNEGGLPVDEFLQDIVDALDGAPLANITIGESATTTGVGDGAVTATCTAEGGRVDVLDTPPVGDIDAPPVMSVVIGSAASSVSVATADGTPTTTTDPAIVSVLVPALGLDIPVGPGETVEIPLPDPLGTSTISVAGGSTGTDENGLHFARASGVRLHLVPGLEGGIELALADCLSVAGATVEAAPPATEPPPAPAGPLPRTGGTNGLALAAAVAFAGLGVTLLRRSSVR